MLMRWRERSLQLYIDYLEEHVEIAAGIWVADRPPPGVVLRARLMPLYTPLVTMKVHQS